VSVRPGPGAGGRRRRARGFSLLEVIVAFALLALALTFLLGALSGAARQTRHAQHISRASLHAQSLLAQLGSEGRLAPGRAQGTFDQGRYRWSLDVDPYLDPADARTAPAPVGAPQLRQVTLEVRWGDAAGEAMRWQTLRLVPGAERAR
jgi:general secretion pathway protein I